MTNCNANATNSIAKPTNSIANGMNSIAKSPNSIAKTCKRCGFCVNTSSINLYYKYVRVQLVACKDIGKSGIYGSVL